LPAHDNVISKHKKLIFNLFENKFFHGFQKKTKLQPVA